MNHLGAGIMDAVGLASLTADLSSVLQDADVSSSVTIAPPTGTTINRSSGAWTTTETSDTVNALLLALTAREVAQSAGAYRLDDRRLRVLASLLSTAPTTDTRFTASGITYAVLISTLDPLGLHYELIGRRVP